MARGGEQRRWYEVGDDPVRRRAVLLHHAVVCALVLRVRLVRPDRSGQPRRLRVGLAGHERRDRRRVGATLVRVVRETALHEQRAEVRVADAELAVAPRVRRDRRRRIVREADQDLLRGEHDVDGAGEPRHIELSVRVHETHEVERGEVAG